MHREERDVAAEAGELITLLSSAILQQGIITYARSFTTIGISIRVAPRPQDHGHRCAKRCLDPMHWLNPFGILEVKRFFPLIAWLPYEVDGEHFINFFVIFTHLIFMLLVINLAIRSPDFDDTSTKTFLYRGHK